MYSPLVLTSFFFFSFLRVQLICLYCVYPMCVSDAYGGQKAALDHLELEIQTIVKCHVGAENQTWVLCKNRQCS